MGHVGIAHGTTVGLSVPLILTLLQLYVPQPGPTGTRDSVAGDRTATVWKRNLNVNSTR